MPARIAEIAQVGAVHQGLTRTSLTPAAAGTPRLAMRRFTAGQQAGGDERRAERPRGDQRTRGGNRQYEGRRWARQPR